MLVRVLVRSGLAVQTVNYDTDEASNAVATRERGQVPTTAVSGLATSYDRGSLGAHLTWWPFFVGRALF